MSRSPVLALALLAASTGALAVAPRDTERPERVAPRRAASARAESVRPDEPSAFGDAARRFLAAHGGTWEFSADRRTGRATLIQGSGIAVSFAGARDADGNLSVDLLEPAGRALIDAHREILTPRAGRLVLDRATSLVLEDGRLVSLNWNWLVGDVPVEGAGVFVRLNAGRVTQIGSALISDAAPDARPALDPEAAWRRLLAESGDEEVARRSGEPRLTIEVDASASGDLDYRLVWVLRYTTPGRIETWEGRVDAHTGEVVSLVDANAYGRVSGGIHPRTVIDPEVDVPLPFARVLHGATLTATSSGAFTYTGGSASSALAGTYFDVNCMDGCSNPGQPFVDTTVGTGRVDFGFGGVDQVGNGLSTQADRNAFYHLNQVRRIGKKWLPSLAWLDTTIATNVNILDTCNAFYDGTVNFFRSGGGCNNTGEIADVMQHEWGHGLDGNTRGGDGATGEATADVNAMHMTHDARIGPWFRTTGAPVRDLDKDRTAKGLLTRTNIGSKCPTGTGPLGFEVHCEGEIYGQTQWDLVQALTAKHGHATGWRTSEKIFYTSLVNAGSYLSTGSFPIYDAYIQADDDDGNLANGTPNGGEIFTAFNTHGIAGTARTSSPGCARPAQPAVTVTPSCDRFTVAWGAIAGIDHYDVFRSETNADSALFKVGTATAAQSSLVDTDVAPGIDYTYVVMAVTAGGCESTIENAVPARLVQQPILSAVAVAHDDVPQGNRSGFPDPGEDVDLHVTLGNFGELSSPAVSGTLVADTPGVTILQGSGAWAPIPAGGTDPGSGTLRFHTDAAVRSCGDTLRFHLVPSGSTCPAETSWFDVVLGDRATVRADDFETDTGWAVDAAASTATAGAWTRGDPDPTAFQPGDDVSDPGVACWFTAPNPGGDGTDDVDGGVTVLRSPVIDLTGAAGARLSYWRWFANRDLGEDAGDFFKVDVSSNGGTSWVNVETLGTNESAAAWTRREFRVEDFVPLTANFRIRFQASDGPATGNLIEAAVDEVRIQRPVCDPTPACFTPATFAGLASAAAGASCGETDLSWSAATSNCQNATIRYNVYRSTDPGFAPSPASRIATGLTTTSLHDTLLAPGATYYYLVRADDSRSGEDGNLVRRSVVSPSAPDLAAPVFSGLAAAAPGSACGEVALSWAPALESCHLPVSYEIYRSTDSGFVPGPSTRIGSTLSTGFVDVAPATNASFTYVVRARDGAGNEGANPARFTVVSKALDKLLVSESFEAGPAGWAVTAPNDATTGNWELGDPQPTAAQPGDDATPDPGINGWITGLAAGAGDGDFDVDNGTTTLLSGTYSLAGAVDPVVRYARWYSNSGGANPGEDLLDVHVSNDDGATFSLVEQVGAVPLGWTVSSHALNGTTTPTATMRFRFTARDLGVGGSLVEAGVDEFQLIDRNQGCGGCPLPVPEVGTILVSRSGADVVLDWSSDPTAASRYVVYRMEGPAFDQPVRVGTSTVKGFVHEGAATSDQPFFYRVSAVDACGGESAR